MGLSDHSQLSGMFIAVGLLIASNKFQKENLEHIAIIPALRRLKRSGVCSQLGLDPVKTKQNLES